VTRVLHARAAAATVITAGCAAAAILPAGTPAAATQGAQITGYAGKCVDDWHSGTVNGSKTDIYTCNGTAAQKWTLTSSGELVSEASGKCLNDAAYGGQGSKVILWTCGNYANEHWAHTTAGQYTLAYNGLCLNDPAYSTANGTQLIIWACGAYASERWSPPSAAAPQPSWEPGGNLPLVFDDEFSGSSLGSAWAPSWFGGGVMNNVTTSPANVSVSGGDLILTLASPSSGALVDTDPSQVPAGGFTFGDGYDVEARIWFPGNGAAVGNWPAFWADGQNWPMDGETDIAEGLGTLTSNYHSAEGADSSGTIPGGWAAGWHTYGFYRGYGENYVYWDGHLIRSYPTYDGGAPQYLILNVGSGEGPAAYGTAGEMKVDWVRVWQRN